MSISNADIGSAKSEESLLLDILFLEDCLKNNHLPDNLDYYCKSESVKVRKLALLISLKMNVHLVEKYFSVADPNAAIRALMLARCKDVSVLKKYIFDRTPEVRIAVLQALGQVVLDKTSQNVLLPSLLHLINDTSVKVRSLFCKTLKKFSDIDSSYILRMFDKEKEGTFIYAAEDESLEIRTELLSLLECLIREDTASEVFKFVVDMLNDDSLALRIKCMKLLSKISKNFCIGRETSDLFWLVLSTREQNVKMNRHLVDVLSSIHFADISSVISLFKDIIFKNFENRTVMSILKRAIRRNSELFLNVLSVESKYCASTNASADVPGHENAKRSKVDSPFVFSSPEQRSNYKVEYLCDLLILHEIGKIRSIEINDKIKKDMLALQAIMKKPEASKAEELSSILKILEDCDNAKPEAFEDVFNILRTMRTVSSVGKFLKDYFLNFVNGDVKNILLIPYKFKFGRKKFKRMLKIHHVNFEDVDFGSTIAFIKEILKVFIRHPQCATIRECSFTVHQKESSPFQDFPTELWVEVQCSRICREMKIVIQSGDDYLLFDIKKSMKIVVDCKDSKLKCYVGVVIGKDILKLTSETEISD